ILNRSVVVTIFLCASRRWSTANHALAGLKADREHVEALNYKQGDCNSTDCSYSSNPTHRDEGCGTKDHDNKCQHRNLGFEAGEVVLPLLVFFCIEYRHASVAI